MHKGLPWLLRITYPDGTGIAVGKVPHREKWALYRFDDKCGWTISFFRDRHDADQAVEVFLQLADKTAEAEIECRARRVLDRLVN